MDFYAWASEIDDLIEKHRGARKLVTREISACEALWATQITKAHVRPDDGLYVYLTIDDQAPTSEAMISPEKMSKRILGFLETQFGHHEGSA